MPAPPGSGKSTLCAALICRGWRLLSDELCLIRLCDGAIIPLPRPVSLKNKSIDVIQSFQPSAIFSPRVFDTIKGTVAHMKATGNSVEISHIAAKAGWIIFPKYQQNTVTSLLPLSKARTFMRVAENSFNYSLLGHQGFQVLKKPWIHPIPMNLPIVF